jgi:F-type H+-transporting ATPase subunit b
MIEVLGKIGFDTKLAIANLVNFVVIFLVLRKLVWKPIQDTINDRQKKIDDSLSSLSKAETSVQDADKRSQEIMLEARREADALIEESSSKAKKIEDGAVSKSKMEAQKIKEEALKEIERREDEMKARLKEEVSGLAISMADKIIKEDIGNESKKDFGDKMASV